MMRSTAAMPTYVVYVSHISIGNQGGPGEFFFWTHFRLSLWREVLLRYTKYANVTVFLNFALSIHIKLMLQSWQQFQPACNMTNIPQQKLFNDLRLLHIPFMHNFIILDYIIYLPLRILSDFI